MKQEIRLQALRTGANIIVFVLVRNPTESDPQWGMVSISVVMRYRKHLQDIEEVRKGSHP